MADMSDVVTLGDVVEAHGPAPQDVASVLRAAHDRAKAEQKPLDLVVPGYGEPESELHVTFKTLADYKQVRDTIRAAVKRQQAKTDAQREVILGIETLALAAEGSYALVGGQRVEIGLPLGLALYEYLFPGGTGPQPQNDAQAITLVYDNHITRVMRAAAILDEWITTGRNPLDQDGSTDEAVEKVLGESQAG